MRAFLASLLMLFAGSFPHFLRLRTSTSGGARALFAVHGVVIPFSRTNTRVERDDDSGTFRYSPGGPNATTDVARGAYACG